MFYAERTPAKLQEQHWAQDTGFSAWEMLVSVDYGATCCLTSWPSFHTKAGKHLPLLADLLV